MEVNWGACRVNFASDPVYKHQEKLSSLLIVTFVSIKTLTKKKVY